MDNSMKRTIEVLSDKELMEQVREGKKKGVKVRDFEEVQEGQDLYPSFLSSSISTSSLIL